MNNGIGELIGRRQGALFVNAPPFLRRASLQRNGEVNLFVISRPSDTEKAIAGVHEIHEINEEPWALHCYLLAETEEEACYKGKPLLEKLVERGEFKLDGKIH